MSTTQTDQSVSRVKRELYDKSRWLNMSKTLTYIINCRSGVIRRLLERTWVRPV